MKNKNTLNIYLNFLKKSTGLSSILELNIKGHEYLGYSGRNNAFSVHMNLSIGVTISTLIETFISVYPSYLLSLYILPDVIVPLDLLATIEGMDFVV